MTLRVKSPSELKRMRADKTVGERAAQKIEGKLAELNQAGPAPKSPALKKRQRKRPQTEAELYGLECSPIPPTMPADILYQAMVRRWGRFYNGGEVVWELQPFPGVGYRLDAALPRFKCGVEMDGWQYHGQTLSGFKKSRDKQRFFCRRGWLFFQISNEQVRNELDDVIESIAEGVSYQVRREVQLKMLPKGWSRIIEES